MEPLRIAVAYLEFGGWELASIPSRSVCLHIFEMCKIHHSANPNIHFKVLNPFKALIVGVEFIPSTIDAIAMAQCLINIARPAPWARRSLSIHADRPFLQELKTVEALPAVVL